LTALQQSYLGRRVPAGKRLADGAVCARQGVPNPDRGPGDNWFCTIYVPRPPGEPITVGYEVSVKPNGCYTAAGAPSFIGPLTIRRPGHAPIINPLFRFDGCFEVAP
jgi:hypothetical protein